MKILKNFRLELPILRAIEELKQKLNLQTETDVIKEAIKQLAYTNGIDLKPECRWLQGMTREKNRIMIYCGLKTNWIPYNRCLTCKNWGRRILS